jgi:hypothetical protein
MSILVHLTCASQLSGSTCGASADTDHDHAEADFSALSLIMIFCVVDEPLHGRGRNHFLEKTMHTAMDPVCFQGSTAQVLQAWP